jgi:hypothetical protein
VKIADSWKTRHHRRGPVIVSTVHDDDLWRLGEREELRKELLEMTCLVKDRDDEREHRGYRLRRNDGAAAIACSSGGA